jgi:hypothetical protein
MQNDIQVLEATRVLTQKTSNNALEANETIESLFEKILIRKPKSDELGTLIDYYEKSLKEFSENSEKAENLVKVGEYTNNISNVSETAALMLVAQVLYNLDETITKE